MNTRIIHPIRIPAPVVVLVLAINANADSPDSAILDAGLEDRLGLTFSPDGKTGFRVEWNGKWGRMEHRLRRLALRASVGPAGLG